MAWFSSARSCAHWLGQWYGGKRSFWSPRRDIKNQILQYRSSRDALTGTASRQQLGVVLDHQWRCAIAIFAPTSLSVLLVEVDYFTDYVEMEGVSAAHTALQQVACTLSNSLSQPGSLVGRYDDQRFLAILPRKTLEEALDLAKVLRATVEACHIPHPQSPISNYVTISLGVASAIPAVHTNPAPLLEEAQQALLVAQRRGGNQVMISDSAHLASVPSSSRCVVRESARDAFGRVQ